MTHDPMCPVIPADEHFSDWGCQCYLIAKVMADCLEKVEGAYIVGSDGEILNPSHPEYSHDGTDTWNNAISTAIAYMTGEID